MTTLEFSYSLNKLSSSLKPYALKLTRDMDDANDLLQDTMVKAFTNRDKFAEGTNLKAWLYTIMKNTFITNYQKMVRRGTFVDTTDNLHFINSGEILIENQAFEDFVLKDVHQAIEDLDEVYKTPFMLHYQGFKYHEIADQLEIPIGTVKNRIHIARKILKDILNVYEHKI
jgi:RNA polymerase sigma factor (sigma-70 family)